MPESPSSTSILDEGPLLRLATESAQVLGQRDWRHRQVDSIVVTDTLNTRTRTSVDFTIPECAPVWSRHMDSQSSSLDAKSVFYLPVAVLAKWPPLANFDLHDDMGRSLPLLGKQENREIDAAALCALLPSLPPVLAQRFKAVLRTVVTSEPEAAPGAFQGFMELLLPLLDQLTKGERFHWALVKLWASVLSTNSLLWVPVAGRPGDRRVVKFAFEQPLEPALHFWNRVEQAFSFAPAVTSISIPQIAAVGSYHLQFEAPPDLQVISARLRLGSGPSSRGPSHAPQTASPGLMKSMPTLARRFARWFAGLLDRAAAEFLTKLRRYSTAATESRDRDPPVRLSQLEPAAQQPYHRISRRRAHLYVSEPALGLPVGGVQIGIRAAREGLITGAFIASILIALVMSVYAAAASTITAQHPSAAVTVLVLGPGLIGYLAVRPNEHPLLRRHVRSVRLLLLLAASVPMFAAIFLVAMKDGGLVQWAWIGLALVSWLLAGLLAISWLLPGIVDREL